MPPGPTAPCSLAGLLAVFYRSDISYFRRVGCRADRALAGKSRRRVNEDNEDNEPSSSVSNSSRLPPVGAAGLS